MPLRDHFRPPVSKRSSWEGFHAMWPGNIVRQLRTKLPEGYIAEPRVHLGAEFEIDIGAFESESDEFDAGHRSREGGLATAAYAVAEPDVAIEAELPEQYEYEVRVYDVTRDRTLVAAIELVSPANKDRPEHRNDFVAKCAALLRKGIAVTFIDLVTVRHFNLLQELVQFVGLPKLSDRISTESIYAASVRWVRVGKQAQLQLWYKPVAVGAALPTLPLWLTETSAIPVDFEASYEAACYDLRIT